MAVRPSLPVPGVDVILGNLLAKDQVWPSGPVPPVVTAEPTEAAQHHECAVQFPDVFTACAVTRAKSCAQAVEASEAKRFIPQLPAPFAHSDFVLALKADEGLTEWYEAALPEEKLADAERGYFISNGLLVRKWVLYNDEMSETLSQIVVPKKYRDQVLQTAHGDTAGHFGVRKTYNRLLQHLYWPRLKRDVADCQNMS